MDRPPTHRPRPPNSPSERSPLHYDEGCNVNPLQHPSEPSVVLPVQNDIAISAVETTSSRNTAAPIPTPPTSCPATFASFTTCSSPPPSAVPSSAEELAPLVAADEYFQQLKGLGTSIETCIKLLSEIRKTRQQHRSSSGVAEFVVDRFRQRRLSSSSQPSEPSVVLPVQNDIAISAVKTTSWNTAAPTPMPPTSCPATFTSPPSSAVLSTEELSSIQWAQLLGENFYQKLSCLPPVPQVTPSSSSQPGSCEGPCTSAPVKIPAGDKTGILWSLVHYCELAETEDHRLSSELVNLKYHFLQEWLSSGLPLLKGWSSCAESCTSAHAGQASSSEDKIEAAPGVSRIPTTSDSRDLGDYETPTK